MMQQQMGVRGLAGAQGPPGGFLGSTVQNRHAMLHTNFKNATWPANMLNADNVLDYFCDPANPFYDTGSCNQQIRMQNINRPLIECLAGMPGIQFILVHDQPPLFVILKQQRQSLTQVTPITYYYVVTGTVYQAPDLYSLVQSRLLGALNPLKEAFAAARECARFNVAKGYYWEFKKEGKKRKTETEGEGEKKPEEVRSTLFQRTRVDRLLGLLTEKFPPPAADNLNVKPDQLPLPDDSKSETASQHASTTLPPTTSKANAKRPIADLDGQPSAKRPKTEVKTEPF